jgi:hypothetical protein
MGFEIFKRYICHPFNSLGERRRNLTADVQSLYLLAKEAWQMDRTKASFILIDRVLDSVSRYVETVVNASLLTQSILALQHHSSFSTDSFRQLVLLRIFIAAFDYGRVHYTSDIKKALRATLKEKRVLKLLTKYFQLPYLQQKRESTQSRFQDVSPASKEKENAN